MSNSNARYHFDEVMHQDITQSYSEHELSTRLRKWIEKAEALKDPRNEIIFVERPEDVVFSWFDYMHEIRYCDLETFHTEKEYINTTTYPVDDVDHEVVQTKTVFVADRFSDAMIVDVCHSIDQYSCYDQMRSKDHHEQSNRRMIVVNLASYIKKYLPMCPNLIVV